MYFGAGVDGIASILCLIFEQSVAPGAKVLKLNKSWFSIMRLRQLRAEYTSAKRPLILSKRLGAGCQDTRRKP